MNEIIACRRLPLQGSPNTRDLGGYACKGGITRWKAVLRSGSTYEMTGRDLDFLKKCILQVKKGPLK